MALSEMDVFLVLAVGTFCFRVFEFSQKKKKRITQTTHLY